MTLRDVSKDQQRARELELELEAVRAIESALASLEPGTRLRVLHFCQQRTPQPPMPQYAMSRGGVGTLLPLGMEDP